MSTVSAPEPVAGRPGRVADLVRRLGPWTVVVLGAVLFLGLVAVNVNGSSMAVLGGKGYRSDPALVAGQPRPIRVDEFGIETPLAVSAARQGFPGTMDVGLSATPQTAVAHGAPSWDWSEVFRPQDWGYLVLGPARGLAVHWWFPLLLALGGMVALLTALGVGARLTAALAVVATFTPNAAWWSSPTPALVVGYSALVGACLLLAVRTPDWRRAALAGVGAGVATVCLALVLYPPWAVGAAVVIAGLVVGEAIERRASWRSVVAGGVTTLVVALPVLALWYLANKTAIQAVLATYYPGGRVSRAGEARLSVLLDAPLNPMFSGVRGDTLASVTGADGVTNLSEVSASWLPLPLLVVVVVVAVLRWLHVRARSEVAADVAVAEGAVAEGAVADDEDESVPRRVATPYALWGVAISALVLLVWALLPLPSWTGAIVLGRIPGARTTVALGMAAVLLVALVVRLPVSRSRAVESTLWVVALVVTILATVWSAFQLPWDTAGAAVPALVLGAVVALGFTAVASGRSARWGALLLAVFAFWSWALVNPLQHGLGILDRSALVRTMKTIAANDPGMRVLVVDDASVPLVRAAGVQVVSGVTFFPEAERMQRLAPTQKRLWNNYAQYVWKVVPGTQGVVIEQIRGTLMQISADPCSSEIKALGAKVVVSGKPLTLPCLTEVQHTTSPRAYFYRVAES